LQEPVTQNYIGGISMLQIHETGELIRALRKQKDLTQEALAGYANIDVATLSKIENGHAMPKQGTFRRLLDVLNFDAGNVAHLFLTKDEIAHEEIHNELNRQAQLAEFKLREDANAAAGLADYLDALAQNEDFLSIPRNKQYYERHRSRVYVYAAHHEMTAFKGSNITVKEYKELKSRFTLSHQVALGLENALEILSKAIKLTIPSFEIKKISEYYLTPLERALIADLADVYDFIGETDKSIDIYKELVKLKGKTESPEKNTYSGIIIHLVVTLMYQERYEEAIRYATEGMEFCVTFGNTSFLPFLAGVKAYTIGNAYGINEDGTAEEKARAKEVKELYRYAYYYALLAKDQYIAHTCNSQFTLWFKENIDGTPL